MSDYTSWQDLLEEDSPGLSNEEVAGLGAEALSGSSASDGADPMAQADGALGGGLDEALGKMGQGDVAGGLDALVSKVPGLQELMAKQELLRDTMEVLTGQKGEQRDPRFPLPDGPRKPLGGGDPQRKSGVAEGSAGPQAASGGAPAPSADARRDEARDARRWGVEPDFFAALESQELDRDAARDQERHLLAFERTEQRMARTGRAAPVSRAAAMRQQFQAHTDRMQRDREALRGRRERAEAQGQGRRVARLQAREARMDQRVQRRQGVVRRDQERHARMREKQAAMRRAHERMKNKQMRIRHGAAWLPKPALRDAPTSGGGDFSTFIKRLPLKELAGALVRGDKLDIGWPFQRDAEAERRRREAQERRRRERAEARKKAQQDEERRDESKRDKRQRERAERRGKKKR